MDMHIQDYRYELLNHCKNDSIGSALEMPIYTSGTADVDY